MSDKDFCEGCCYNNNKNPVFNCNKVNCCYLKDYEYVSRKGGNIKRKEEY